jgi:hypothetical protein
MTNAVTYPMVFKFINGWESVWLLCFVIRVKPIEMKLFTLSILITILSMGACQKNDDSSGDCDNGTVVTLVDMTGLDGCTWLFDAGSTRYEAVNLGDFNVPLIEDQLYCIRFTVATDMASICMAGELIRLTDIKPIGD